MKPFTTDVAIEGERCTVALVGECDLASAPDLIEVGMDGLQRPTTAALHFDLSEVTFIDSTGIGALVRLQNEANRLGKQFQLSGVPERVRALLAITGLDGFFGTGPH
jgi:anti-sigma B factor antagonist